MPALSVILADESVRAAHFPIVRHRTFLAHAAVTALPVAATDALRWFADQAGSDQQESPAVWKRVLEPRQSAARLIGAEADEIALLGPTALGLNLVADGLDWKPGDEVVYYPDDYPANVYPWTKLADLGVVPVPLRPERSGQLTPELVQSVLTPRTKLVALASAHFFTGFRIEAEKIGAMLHDRGILFCLDGIQTLGAFPIDITYIDFISADSHKWMLGPLGAGIFYVKKCHFDRLKPSLLGSWNVFSPNFIAQADIKFYPGARRYEPGSLNVPGILAMKAGVDLILELGPEAVAARISKLRRHCLAAITSECFEPVYDETLPDANSCGIVSFRIHRLDDQKLAAALQQEKISVSIRHDRAGHPHLRLAPHAYNTEDEINRVAEALRAFPRH